MDQIQELEMSAPVADPGVQPRPRGRLRKLSDRVVVWLHRQAERADLVPAEFAAGREIDAADAEALRDEWVRQLRLWADHNPEELLAWKAGVAVLGAALLVLVIVVRALG